MSINTSTTTTTKSTIPSGTIKPGSIDLKDVPVDKNGNITKDFMNQLFKTDNPVNMSLTDSTDPSGLSDWARVGVRLIGHDLYDGKLNGDSVLRTLLAPDASNNRPVFEEHGTIPPEEVATYTDIVRQWGAEDLKDDGKINGSAEKKMLGQLLKITDHVDMTRQLAALPNTSASLNAKELYRTTDDVETPDGLAAFTKDSGISAVSLENFSMWGHRILDPKNTSKSIATSALNDPTSIDFGLAHYDTSTQNFTTVMSKLPANLGKAVTDYGILSLMTQASYTAARQSQQVNNHQVGHFQYYLAPRR
jgi:hypothetical protein